MERVIEISVRDRIAWQTNKMEYICGNGDFVVDFLFDDEWPEAKTARFIHGGQHTDVVFTGSRCEVPKILDVKTMQVGVYAGDLQTTTKATVGCKTSILCDAGLPADPEPDVYTQLMEKIDSGMLQGPQGEPGPKGEPGYTPVKGKDYWTEADKDEIKDYVDEQIGTSGSAEGAVLYTPQTLTPEQRAQARENIGAANSAELGSAKDVFPVECDWFTDPDESGVMFGIISILPMLGQNTHLLGKTLCVKTYAYGDITYRLDSYGEVIEEAVVNPNADIDSNPESGVCEFEIAIPDFDGEQLDILIPFVENPYTELEIYEKRGTVWEEIKAVSNNSVIASGCGPFYYWRKWGDGFAEIWMEINAPYDENDESASSRDMEIYITLPTDLCFDIPPKVVTDIRGYWYNSQEDMEYAMTMIPYNTGFMSATELAIGLETGSQTLEAQSVSGQVYITGYWKYVEEAAW